MESQALQKAFFGPLLPASHGYSLCGLFESVGDSLVSLIFATSLRDLGIPPKEPALWKICVPHQRNLFTYLPSHHLLPLLLPIPRLFVTKMVFLLV